MTSRRKKGAIGLLALAGGTAWEAQRRIDRSRVAGDPDHAQLTAPLGGRRVPVSSGDGTELHAEVFGPDSAPTVVLVHGWTCTLRFWIRQIQDLSSDLRVVAFDLRGHGRSAASPTGDYSTEAFAADLGAVLDRCLAADERAIVAGHSLGAMTLVALAGRDPELVRRRLAGAALVNTGLGDLISESLVLRAPTRLDRAEQLAGRLALSAKVPIPKGSTPISSRLVRYVALGPGASPAQVAFCEQMVLECRREVRAACGATMSRLDLHESVASLATPTVLVAGEEDRLTPPSHARRLAEALPHLFAHLELPGVGHMAPVEAPEAVTGQLRELVEDRLPSAATARRRAPTSPQATPIA